MTAQREQDQRIREAVAADPYASAVLDVLAGDFPDLRDPHVAALVRKRVYLNARVPGHLEVILDDPGRANWRLVGAAADRRRVHLGCWKLNRTNADRERLDRLNAALDALDTKED